MFCNQCGNPIPDGATFCPVCGAKSEEMMQPATEPMQAAQPVQTVTESVPDMAQPMAPVQQPAAQPAAGVVPPVAPQKKSGKGFPFKLMIPVAGVFVLLVVVLVAVLMLGKGSGYDTYLTKDLDHNYDPNIFYVFPDTEKTYECEEENLDSVQYSGDYSRAIFTAYDEYDEMMLYYIDTDLEAKLIAEDVDASYISYTGEYVVYLQDVEDDVAGDLYIYCVKTGDITKLDKNVYPYGITMSPNGKVVCYIKDYKSEDKNTLCIGGIGRDSKEIDDDGCRPLAVTDNGKYVYYINADRKLYLYNGKESAKITSGIDGECWLNKDATEILYTKDGKTYYHTVKMDEAVKIASDKLLDVIVPSDVVYFYGGNAYLVGVSTFKGAVLSCSEKILWLNDKGTETVKICANSDLYQLSEDGKSFIYVERGDLYKIKKLNEKMEAVVICDDMTVEDMAASADLSKIYIANDEDLYYVKGENKFEKITNDLAEGYYGYSIAYNEKMGKIFFIEDDTLCYAGTTEKSKEDVEEDVYTVYESRKGIIFVIEEDDYDYTYYYMDSKEVIELDWD